MILLLATLTAQVAMRSPPPVQPGIAALPRITRPATDATRRINAAVARLDARVRSAARDCRAGSTRPTRWRRSVAVTMRGPAFVSYRVADDVDCGGAHPDEAHSAIVYDLATGAPVDWTALLSRRLAGALALTEGADGVRVVTLDSPRLRALYAGGYNAAARAAGAPAECLDAARDEGFVQPMQAWLDARAGGLALSFDLNHAMQACAATVVIPAAVLQREGAAPRLVSALAAGRGR